MSYTSNCFGLLGQLDGNVLEKIYWDHLDKDSRKRLRLANGAPVVGIVYLPGYGGRQIVDPHWYDGLDPDAFGEWYEEEPCYNESKYSHYEETDFAAYDGPWDQDDDY
jgi:hypothetical protein